MCDCQGFYEVDLLVAVSAQAILCSESIAIDNAGIYFSSMVGFHIHAMSFGRFSAMVEGQEVYGPAACFAVDAAKMGAGRYVCISTRRQNILYYTVWLCTSSEVVAIPSDASHVGSFFRGGRIQAC